MIYIANKGNINDLLPVIPIHECDNYQITQLDQGMPVQWEAIVLHKKSTWLNRINFNIAQRTPFLYDRHEYLSHTCKQHFYPTMTRAAVGLS
jgi:hypothetical protein